MIKSKLYFRNLLHPVRLVLTCLLDTLLLLVPRQNQTRSKKHVLIIRLDAIGDFILWLDTAKELRDLYPEDTHRITLLANIAWAPIAESLSYFDEVWAIEKSSFDKNLLYRWQRLLKVRRASFDTAIQPAFSREFLFGDSIIRVCGANERIGSESDLSNLRPWLKPICDAWYTKLIPATAIPLMELERNAEFMRGLGLTEFRAAPPKLSIPNHTRVTETEYFVIFPGAFFKYRQWDIDCFREIACRLHLATGWKVVACGGPGEEYLGLELTCDTNSPLINMIGTTTLLELAAIIKNAQLVIANETVAVHIAAAVSTPAVCILGGGHYGRFMPYKVEKETITPLPLAVIHLMDCFGCNWQCIYDVPPGQPKPCIDKITVYDVWEAVKKFVP